MQILPLLMAHLCLIYFCDCNSSFTFVKIVFKEIPVIQSTSMGVHSALRCGAACSERLSPLCLGFQMLDDTCVLFSGTIVENDAPTFPVSDAYVGYKLNLLNTAPTEATTTITPTPTFSSLTSSSMVVVQSSSTASRTSPISSSSTTIITNTPSFTIVPLPPVFLDPMAVEPTQQCTDYTDFKVKTYVDKKWCLAAIQPAATFDKAQELCASRGAIVAFASAASKMYKIQDVYYDRFTRSPELWIGAVYNPSESRWEGPRSGQTFGGEANWAGGQPEVSGDKNCVYAPYTGHFHSGSCAETKDYVCEKYDVLF